MRGNFEINENYYPISVSHGTDTLAIVNLLTEEVHLVEPYEGEYKSEARNKQLDRLYAEASRLNAERRNNAVLPAGENIPLAEGTKVEVALHV